MHAYLRCNLLDRGALDILHVAPEPFLKGYLKAWAGGSYVTTDLNSPGVDVRCSLEDIPLAGACFDVVYCSSVLQFVRDDKRALSELCRVLRTGGMALISVPVHDLAMDYSEVQGFRKYDKQFQALVEEAGFSVEQVSAASFVGGGDCVRLGLPDPDGHPLFLATKVPEESIV